MPRSHDMDKRSREYGSTVRQRRFITKMLRERFDMALPDNDGSPFSVYVRVSEIPGTLTSQNERMLLSDQTDDDLNKLFGIIALDSTIHISQIKNDYIVSLTREAPGL